MRNDGDGIVVCTGTGNAIQYNLSLQNAGSDLHQSSSADCTQNTWTDNVFGMADPGLHPVKTERPDSEGSGRGKGCFLNPAMHSCAGEARRSGQQRIRHRVHEKEYLKHTIPNCGDVSCSCSWS